MIRGVGRKSKDLLEKNEVFADLDNMKDRFADLDKKIGWKGRVRNRAVIVHEIMHDNAKEFGRIALGTPIRMSLTMSLILGALFGTVAATSDDEIEVVRASNDIVEQYESSYFQPRIPLRDGSAYIFRGRISVEPDNEAGPNYLRVSTKGSIIQSMLPSTTPLPDAVEEVQCMVSNLALTRVEGVAQSLTFEQVNLYDDEESFRHTLGNDDAVNLLAPIHDQESDLENDFTC